MNPKVIVAPTDEPITVDEARSHIESLRYGDPVVDDADDAMIEGWISAAREYCEGYMGLTLATKTLEIAMDAFPGRGEVKAIELPFGPVREVLSVSWSDDSDGEMDAADFVLDTYSNPARISPVSDWPYVAEAVNAIKIRYLAGYGVDSDGGEVLPKSIRAAMLLIIGHLYLNREETTDQSLSTIPMGAHSMMAFGRIRLGMA